MIDLFLANRPEALLTCDQIAFYSDWWRTWMIEYFQSKGLIGDCAEFARQFAPHAAMTGFTALDAARSIDPEQVRARWNIPRGQPVVTLLPFPQGVGKATFWPRKIYGEPSRLGQWFNMVAHGRFEYWQHVRAGSRDLNVVRAIRRFCDRHGAFLLVKSRAKTPIPEYLRAVADKCIYDENYYPATVLEALSISSLSISYYSATVTEAVPLGVPHLCITMDGREYCGDELYQLGHYDRFFNSEEGGVFQFEGATTTVGIPEAVDLLDGAALDNFRMDQAARHRYVLKFLGYDDFNASTRVLDSLERIIGRSVASSWAAGERSL